MNFIDFFYPVLIIIMLTAIFILGYRYKGIHDRMAEMEETLREVIFHKQRIYLQGKNTDETLKLSRLINQLLDLYLDEKAVRRQEWASKQRLTANLSKFITHPIHGAAEQLETAMTDPKNRVTCIKTALEDMNQVKKRADQMSALNDLENDPSIFPLESTDICHLVSQVVSELEPSLKQNHFTLEARIPQKKYMANVNPQGIETLLRHLIENASTHGKSGHYIGIQVHLDHDYDDALAVEVIDHGKGMSLDHLNAIFSVLQEDSDLFPDDDNESASKNDSEISKKDSRKSAENKNSKDSKKESPGNAKDADSKWSYSGLGLAMACLLAKKSGGGLGAFSKPGQTVFKLLLPLE